MCARISRLIILLVLLASPLYAYGWEQTGGYRFTQVERIVAIGDVHGALPELKQVLKSSGLIDDTGQWRGGKAHLVSVGDLLDRGPDSRGVMDLLMALQVQAEQAGGKVHVVMGNHEVMNLTGELSYVTAADYAHYTDLETPDSAIPGAPAGFAGQRRAMAMDGPYGRWLLQRPVAIVINGTLFLHGGLSKRLLDLDLDSLNARAHKELKIYLRARKIMLHAGVISPQSGFRETQMAARSNTESETQSKRVRKAARELDRISSSGLLFAADGPDWYRGTALCHPFTEQQTTDVVLHAFDARSVVIGHTPTADRNIQSRMDGKVLRIDTGMNTNYYHGHPAALIIRGDQLSVRYTDLPRQTVEVQANRSWKRPWGMSDGEIEDLLQHGEITRVEDLDVGITKPKRVTLHQGERKIRAVFKSLDTHPKLKSKPWKRSSNKNDRYVYDLVAYKLDRLLGFDMVPPAVIRTIDGHKGVLQYWIEHAITEKDRRSKSIDYTGECTPSSQFTLMNVFDALIYNEDRNLSNVLYTRRDWDLWLIDHTRAFRGYIRIPNYLRKARFDMTPQLRDMLAQINRKKLAPLTPYLHSKQIAGIVARARLLRKLP